MPGLDGMRALAVVTVMIYHANSDWLKGGFLGVEVFFVISGYLITLLLISEHERDHSVDMKQFWIRRARRLLPALFVMLFLLTIWTALFERSTLGKLRGDIVAALGYGSNWYQVYTGQGYSAANDFAPLRHLWSLAVEEQFYLIWPIVMVLLLRVGSRGIADLSRWLFGVGARHHRARRAALPPGSDRHARGHARRRTGTSSGATSPRPTSCTCRRSPVPAVCCSDRRSPWSGARWRSCAGRCANARSAARRLRRRRPRGARADDVVDRLHRLRRRRSAAVPRRILPVGDRHARRDRRGHPPPHDHVDGRSASRRWCGSVPRSYGLYLYHWPIYQLIRNIAGKHMKFHEFVIAMATHARRSPNSRTATSRRRSARAPSGSRGSRCATTRDPGPPQRRARRRVRRHGARHLRRHQPGHRRTEAERRAESSTRGGAESTCDVLADPTCGGGDDGGSDRQRPGDRVRPRRRPSTHSPIRPRRRRPTTTIATDDDDHDPATDPDARARRLGDARCGTAGRGARLRRRRGGEPPVRRRRRGRRDAEGAGPARRRRAVHLGTNGDDLAESMDG